MKRYQISTVTEQEKFSNELNFDELINRFSHKDYDTLSFLNHNLELLYDTEKGGFKLYRLTYNDFITLNLEGFLTKKGYKNFSAENYPSRIFAYCSYQIHNNVIALAFLDHTDGVYALDMATYYNQKLVSFTTDPICYSYSDIGFVGKAFCYRVNNNEFIGEAEYIFEGHTKEHYEFNLQIDDQGKLLESRNDLFVTVDTFSDSMDFALF